MKQMHTNILSFGPKYLSAWKLLWGILSKVGGARLGSWMSDVNMVTNADRTSLKADREVFWGGLTWNHFDFTSISLWPPSKHAQITMKTEGPGLIAPGGRGISGTRGTSETQISYEKQSTASLFPSEPMQEAPGKLHHLAEQLFIWFRNKVERKAKGQGTGTGALMTIKSPATGSRTQEPFRFPGLSKQPPI